MPANLHLVAYDVRTPARLAAARRAVTSWAHGGQRSVWECWARPTERDQLYGAVGAPLDLAEDCLALFTLPRSGPFIALGRGRPPELAQLLYVG